jgi:dolichol-phosphate mannosyltransferase
MCDLTVVVPALNEVGNIERVLDDLAASQALAGRRAPRILVVDDGSTDGTASVCTSWGGPLRVQTLCHPVNLGPGAAFRTGFAAALEGADADALVLTIEADSTSDLGALPEMFARAADGADCVLASVHGGGRMLNVPWQRRLLSAGASRATRCALGLDAHTVSSFFRVYRGSALQTAFDHYGPALITESGFACKAEILMKLARLGMRIEEVPVDLDAAQRVGASKMPLLRTVAGYGRLMARDSALMRRTSG